MGREKGRRMAVVVRGQGRGGGKGGGKWSRSAKKGYVWACSTIKERDKQGSGDVHSSGHHDRGLIGVKRHFVVMMHTALPACACEYRLTSLARYRQDLVARVTASALLVSNASRRDTGIDFVFPPTTQTHHGEPLPLDAGNQYGFILHIDGALGVHARADERNMASAIRRACYPIHCLMNGNRNIS